MNLIGVAIIFSSLSAAWVAWLRYKMWIARAPELEEIRARLSVMEMRYGKHSETGSKEP